jgi:hypothetical protein
MGLVRTYWRAAAVAACLLGLFWSVALDAFLWAGVNPYDGGDDWLFRDYFLNRYVAALVFGLVVAEWWVVNVAGFGALAALIVTLGARETVDQEKFGLAFGSAWSDYLEAALPWLWIAGLIALGIILSRQLGGLRIPPASQP